MAVLCAVAGYVGAEQDMQVDGELTLSLFAAGLSGCLALVVASQDGALPHDPRGRAGGRDSAAGRAGAHGGGAET